MVTGYYAGSFDPLTHGHGDIITRALRLVDTLVIGVGIHHGKKALLSADQRCAIIEQEMAAAASEAGKAFKVITFAGLVVDAARDAGATVMFRGLRDAGDFDYERQMAQTNAQLAPDIETVFLAAAPETSFIASSLVKQIAAMGGDISPFVSQRTANAIAAALANK
jgi:pantetheine-phosphate adenylyltransferase